MSAFVINVVISVLLTVLFRAVRLPVGVDATAAHDFYSNDASPTVAAEAEATLAAERGTRQP